MTKLLRDNFAELYGESSKMLALKADDLVVDIGSNDGTLISNFQNGGHRILGIEPTDVGDIANRRGIPTLKRYFGTEVAHEVKREYGPGSGITAANCFPQHEDVNPTDDLIVEIVEHFHSRAAFVKEDLGAAGKRLHVGHMVRDEGYQRRRQPALAADVGQRPDHGEAPCPRRSRTSA